MFSGMVIFHIRTKEKIIKRDLRQFVLRQCFALKQLLKNVVRRHMVLKIKYYFKPQISSIIKILNIFNFKLCNGIKIDKTVPVFVRNTAVIQQNLHYPRRKPTRRNA